MSTRGADRACRIARPRKVRTALDVGCGEGHFTLRMAQCADRVSGIDVSPTAIRRASEQLAGQARCEFRALDIVADDLETEFGEQRFDLGA